MSQPKARKRRPFLERGFTLIEIVIVLLIASIVLAAIISLARPYFEERIRNQTINAVRSVEGALADYLERVGAYPCPAPLNTPRGSAEDGAALCTADGAGVIEVAGRPDALGAPRPVLIGAVPYRDLGIPVDATIDAHKNRLTYAVSLPSTTTSYIDDLNDLDLHTGAIDVVDESGASLLGAAGTAHVFFFSHGRNGQGSHTDGGVANGGGACTGLDAENCDGNATFLAALQSHGMNPQYHDDVSTYSILAEGEDDDLWDRTPADTNNIYNLNTGNVGVGTDTPSAKFDVAGEVRIAASDPALACAAATEGAIRYREAIKNVEFCDGVNWRMIGQSGPIRMVKFATSGAHTYTVPDGVFRIQIEVAGAGGAGGNDDIAYKPSGIDVPLPSGGNSSFSGTGVSITANGGNGGVTGWYNDDRQLFAGHGLAGSANGIDIVLRGGQGGAGASGIADGGACSIQPGGNVDCSGSGDTSGNNWYLGRHGGIGSTGGNGAAATGIMSVMPGQVFTMNVGKGGTPPPHVHTYGLAGQDGWVIITEYSN